VAIVCFENPYAHYFGPPNDEAFSGHPLYAKGLKPYSVSKIENSEWIEELETMNSIHPHHRPGMNERYSHFIFAFHDTTFECVAKGFTVNIQKGSMNLAIQEMMRKLTDES
jgi:hypothetical protein